MNKRQRCEEIYDQIRAEGYEIPAGVSVRRHFMDRARRELNMTDGGAGTYYINAKGKYEGKAPIHRREKVVAVENDSRWSVLHVCGEGHVIGCYPHATEELAWKAYYQLRVENQRCCVVVPGVEAIGKKVVVKSQPNDILIPPTKWIEE